jgi:head-tail adaptor
VRFPAGETVTVVRAALVDDGYGNQVRDWPNATRTPHQGCAVAQNGRDESLTGDRNVVASDLVVFMPSGTDVAATDRLEIRGRDYEVVGEPFDWVSPFTGSAFGVAVYCNRAEG